MCGADFNAVSATHVIAISGANMVILAGLIQGIARRFLDDRSTIIVTIAGLVVYTVFVGGDAAVIRAAIMAILALVAMRLGRQTYGLASLSFAALLMTALNPLTLWDVGFQLSFFATLGLILYVDPMENALETWLAHRMSEDSAREIVGMSSEALIVTIAATLTTTPIMAFHFGRFSPLALIVNLLIVPVQAYIMVLGGLSVFLAMIWFPLGQVVAWAAWVPLAWTVSVVRLFATLPAANLDVAISGEAVALAYALLLGGTWLMMQPETDRKRLFGKLRLSLPIMGIAGIGILLAVLLVSAGINAPDGDLHLTFIDVGDGSATLIESPSGRQVLVDAGGSARQLTTGLGDALPFWDRHIDVLVISQPRTAHTAGLVHALGRYNFDTALTNGRFGTSDAAQAALGELSISGVIPTVAEPGMRIALGDGVTLTVLHTQVGTPADTESAGDPVVILVEFGEFAVLLPGDSSVASASTWITVVPQLSVLGLTQGVDDEVVESLLIATSPQMIVTNTDIASTSGEVRRLDQVGTVIISSDGSGLWTKP